jgi:hypothetical protein
VWGLRSRPCLRTLPRHTGEGEGSIGVAKIASIDEASTVRKARAFGNFLYGRHRQIREVTIFVLDTLFCVGSARTRACDTTAVLTSRWDLHLLLRILSDAKRSALASFDSAATDARLTPPARRDANPPRPSAGVRPPPPERASCSPPVNRHGPHFNSRRRPPDRERPSPSRVGPSVASSPRTGLILSPAHSLHA